MDTETDTDIVQADRQSDIYTEKRIGRIINTIKKKNFKIHRESVKAAQSCSLVFHVDRPC